MGVHQFGTFGLCAGIYYLGRRDKGGLWSGGIEGVPLAATAARSCYDFELMIASLGLDLGFGMIPGWLWAIIGWDYDILGLDW